MTKRSKAILAAVGVVAVLGGGGALAWKAIVSQLRRDEPAHPVVQVQRGFREARESDGHLNHLERGIACTSCHDEGSGRMNRPTAAACERCHATVDVTVHESPASAAASDCLTCHDFAGDRRLKPWGCVRCHAAEDQAAITQIELHADVTCASCHSPHESPSLRPPDCITCHPDESTRHGPKQIDGARRCLDCHSAHDTREAADRRCATCHRGGGTQAPQIALAATFAGGHEKCVTCHTPHEFTRAGVASCTSCHEDQLPVAKHKDCTTCHDQHDARATVATCVGCHQNVPEPPDGHDCLSCHPPHGEGAGFIALVSTGGRLRPAISLKGENCTSCHLQTNHAPGDTTCTSCHTPHRPAPAEDKRLCVRCHTTQVAQTARTHVTAGAILPGHQNCRACHTDPAHRPELARPACSTCHQQEASTAPPGHADCSRCHTTHDGAIRAEATCQACHEDRKTGHGALAIKNPPAKLRDGCASCHRPHGGAPGPSAPPDCSRCHTVADLPGLHRVDDHDLCITCHAAHEDRPRDDRKTCTTTCHIDRRAHEPTAATCSACHPFRR